jgi:hypothetical protein
MFQHTEADKADTWKLVETINNGQEKKVPDGPLSQIFERMWPDLEKELEAIPEREQDGQPERSTDDMIVEVLEIARPLPSELRAVLHAIQGLRSFTGLAGMGLLGIQQGSGLTSLAEFGSGPPPVPEAEPSGLKSLTNEANATRVELMPPRNLLNDKSTMRVLQSRQKTNAEPQTETRALMVEDRA